MNDRKNATRHLRRIIRDHLQRDISIDPEHISVTIDGDIVILNVLISGIDRRRKATLAAVHDRGSKAAIDEREVRPDTSGASDVAEARSTLTAPFECPEMMRDRRVVEQGKITDKNTQTH